MTTNKNADVTLTLVAAAALIRADGAILMQRRPAASQHGGLWEFPGGKREPGETLTACLARELHEELGITVAPGDAAHAASVIVPHRGGELLLVLFTCRRWQGEPTASGGATIAWVELAGLSALPMPPADIPLAAELVRQLGG